MFGIGFGRGDLRRIWWIVGTAVYQFASCVVKSFQNVDAENTGGTMTVPPDARGARKPARSPWTWKLRLLAETQGIGGK